MTSSILWVGGEDLDFIVTGGAVAASGSPLSVISTAGNFRSGYARHALNLNNGGVQIANTCMMGTTPLGNVSSFWFSARLWVSAPVGFSSNLSNPHVWQIRDSSGVVRLRMRNTVAVQAVNNSAGPYAIEKVNAAGTATQLGSNTTTGFSNAPTVANKLDVQVVYAVSGSINIYIDGTLIFSYTGDTTTDSTTTVDSVYFGCTQQGPSNSHTHAWSEMIVATRDTRNFSLCTQAASANGNTHSFDSGAASNINATQFKDNLPDYSLTAAQIDEYTITPAPPTGNFSVISLVHHARATYGSFGPTKLEFVVRTGGVDYFSPDQTLTTAFSLIKYHWDTNPTAPGTSPWLTTDLPASSTSFNYGIKSIT